MMIVGEKEKESGTVSLRKRDAGDMGAVSLSTFLEMAEAEEEA